MRNSEIIAKVYYRNGSDEVRNFKDLAEAVSCLRGERIEIEYALEVEPSDVFGLPFVYRVTEALEAMWMEIERAEHAEEYHRTNPKDMSLEEYVDNKTQGPRYRKPSVRRPETVSRGFTPQSIAAE